MSKLDLQWFADEAEDKESKTEEPSEYKLQKAREEGNIPKSQELNGTIVYIMASIVLIIMAPFISKKCQEVFIFYFSHVTESDVSDSKFFVAFLRYFLMMVLPIAIVGLVAGIISNLIQNRGFIFTTKTIQPKFSKIVPRLGKYFKNTLFSVRGLFNIAKSFLKVILIGIIAFTLIRSELPDILNLLHTSGPYVAMQQVGWMVVKLLIFTSIVLLVLGIFDYIVQRTEFKKEMRMTPQEVKQEFKELEGDPEIKSRLEQAQKEMMKQNLPKVVAASDVVITNPSHYAVALQYDTQISDAPLIAAKGEDLTAQTIKKIAKENDVPIVENQPLARELYFNTEVGQLIPENCMSVIATIYAQIHYVDKHSKDFKK